VTKNNSNNSINSNSISNNNNNQGKQQKQQRATAVTEKAVPKATWANAIAFEEIPRNNFTQK